MINVSYYGKDAPKTSPAAGQSKAPVWSKTWEKSPFNKGVVMDWKTGKLRTPLFEEEEVAPVTAVSNTVINTGSNSVIAKITGGDAVSGYLLDCYPDYPDLVTDKFTATAFIPTISLGGHVVTEPPSGTYIVANYVSLKSIVGD